MLVNIYVFTIYQQCDTKDLFFVLTLRMSRKSKSFQVFPTEFYFPISTHQRILEPWISMKALSHLCSQIIHKFLHSKKRKSD